MSAKIVIFELKCTGCSNVEDRTSSDCEGEQPTCSCGMPMLLERAYEGTQMQCAARNAARVMRMPIFDSPDLRGPDRDEWKHEAAAWQKLK